MSTFREGYTTGTCAAAAAKAAALLLEKKRAPKSVTVVLPGGDRATLPVLYAKKRQGAAEAAVRKDAGDDPDITNGAVVVAAVSWTDRDDVLFAAGEGVGTVTKPGLSLRPGEPAINPVPRRMIRKALREVTERGVRVTISIPGGKALAAKTFNPRLGIAGGLSIIGTSGRVRPFSCPALRASLLCLLGVAASSGVTAPVFVPGRIGGRAAGRHLRLAEDRIIEVGNEWGFMLDQIKEYGFKRILILGHPGKLAKLAGGEWDTHSARSGSALPRVARLAAAALGRTLPETTTVEGVFSMLDGKDRKRVGDILARRIRAAVRKRLGAGPGLAVVLVDMKGEILGTSGGLKRWES